eukprot:TRINITY_DN8427_c0_g1_i1.p1 TRINITY_DN8427_c0_g1~~TRINITY_DN8427_c0_g1_i1.p1  ORF type:complete len:243 (+),score=59.90 TRINITY_DN8427_c0_g1_i1:25-753(+)
MRCCSWAVLLCVAALSVALVAGESSHVVTLASSNISNAYTGTWMVMLYSPQCGFCKRLEPTWNELADSIHDTKYNAKIARVNAAEDMAIITQFGVTGFPTIVFAKDGRVWRYTGERTVPAFITFMRTGYASSEPESAWTGPMSLLMRLAATWIKFVLGLFDAVQPYLGDVKPALDRFGDVIDEYPFSYVIAAAVLVSLSPAVICVCCCCCCGRRAPPRVAKKPAVGTGPKAPSKGKRKEHDQ